MIFCCISQLLWVFSPFDAKESATRVSMIQVCGTPTIYCTTTSWSVRIHRVSCVCKIALCLQILFTRIVDLWNFADVLRQCQPGEQVQVMQRVGYHNCIYTNKRSLAHLHGICFLLRLSVEEVRSAGRPAPLLSP